MYKVLHFGDTHLGRKHPSKISKKRVESSIKAFRHVIQKAIQEDVDFVIHAGDVFDTVYPWHTVIESAKRELQNLEEAEIPLYCIRGNHDRSFGQGRSLKGLAIEHLTSEYVHLIDPQASEFPQNGYIDHDEKIRIYGLGYHASRTQEILRGFTPENNKFNILLMHDFVEGVTRSYSNSIPKADMIAEKDLQYVAIGHDHEPNPEQVVNSTTFSATGGTVDYDFNTTNFRKTFNILEINEENQEIQVDNHKVPQELELRKKKFKVGHSPQQIRNKIEDEVQEDKEYAYKIKIKGEISSDQEIQTQKIADEVEKINQVVLADTLLDVNTDEVEIAENKGEGFNIHEYLEENLQKNKLDENFIQMHERAENMLSNEENLTRSGFSLQKQARKDLRKKIDNQIFGDIEDEA